MTFELRTPGDAASLGTVLGVWAHPDDETYLSAALMTLVRRAGGHVTCATATRGELGTDDPVRWPPARLARTRELEARAAMAVLGVDDHRFLGLADGTLADVEHRDGVDLVARLLREVRPDTVVTFGPEGMTGHPDHRAVSRWVTDAWLEAGGPGRLLHATKPEAFAVEFADLHARIPVFADGLPPRTPPDRIAVAVEATGELGDVKLAALRAQATQVGPLLEALGEEQFTAWCREEVFTSVDARALRPPSPPDALSHA